MGPREKQRNWDLKPRYTTDEAKREIDAILRRIDERCEILFEKRTAEILHSYRVKSVHDRRRICEIIRRTGLTQRGVEDLSAEWRFHNLAWYLHVKRSHARDVSLDYTRDPRRSVRIVTAILNFFDIE